MDCTSLCALWQNCRLHPTDFIEHPLGVVCLEDHKVSPPSFDGEALCLTSGQQLLKLNKLWQQCNAQRKPRVPGPSAESPCNVSASASIEGGCLV